MPCGGISPCEPLGPEYKFKHDSWCFHCDKWLNAEGKTPDHFCEEWDCVLHGSCVAAFLKTAEGKLVVEHGHCVQVYDKILEGGSVPCTMDVPPHEEV